jgi:PilZ domain-containing protein
MQVESLVLMRRCPRFPVAAPVIFRWKDEDGTCQESSGSSRDISKSGIFICSPVSLLPGTEVFLEVHLPMLDPARTPGVRLNAPGRVVRVAGREESSGFAASATFTLPEE